MTDPKTVTLGDRAFPVVPQKHARARKYLKGDMLQKVLTRDYSHEAYFILCKMIPAMDPNTKQNKAAEVQHNVNPGMPEWEFDGFATEEAWQRYKAGDEDAYDEDNDPGPTTDQIVGAFEAVLLANGASRLGKLMTLVQTVASVSQDQPTATPHGSLGENGGSASTTTGTTAPTS